MPKTSSSCELPQKFAYKVTFQGGPFDKRKYWYPIKRNKEVRPEIRFQDWMCVKGHWTVKDYVYKLKGDVKIPTGVDQPFIYIYQP